MPCRLVVLYWTFMPSRSQAVFIRSTAKPVGLPSLSVIAKGGCSDWVAAVITPGLTSWYFGGVVADGEVPPQPASGRIMTAASMDLRGRLCMAGLLSEADRVVWSED